MVGGERYVPDKGQKATETPRYGSSPEKGDRKENNSPEADMWLFYWAISTYGFMFRNL